jgi:hypothetical protein
VDRLISSNAAFSTATGWHPDIVLDDGLRRTIGFFTAHPGLLPQRGYIV